MKPQGSIRFACLACFRVRGQQSHRNLLKYFSRSLPRSFQSKTDRMGTADRRDRDKDRQECKNISTANSHGFTKLQPIPYRK